MKNFNEQTTVTQLSEIKIFRLSLLGCLHLNKQFDAWENY